MVDNIEIFLLNLKKKELVTKLALCFNRLELSFIEDLAYNVTYESQNVFAAIEGKEKVVDYLQIKFASFREFNERYYAELGYWGKTPCLVISEVELENRVAVIMIEIKYEYDINRAQISRIDLCTVAPRWNEIRRTQEFPGLEN